ncbi:DUF4097 family beta strand repeat-containing protein [Telluribacter humicola]|uniref:DUF4097 family beta strand repeat-containing protein n=1 Tax=Telluribacter humicola TaxID=1720261 RepID=UPI001A97A9BC|nr:hypothetical protein [Telluribacter humicola]
MKKLIFPLLWGLVLCCAQSKAQKQEFKEKINREFTLTGSAGASTLAIYNINGFIRVEGTSGNQVTIEVDKELTAKSQQELEEGKQEFKLAFEQVGDTIFAYIAEPFDTRPNRERRNWDRGKLDYDFTLNYTVKVPRQMNLKVSTINRGDVVVKDVAGALRVRNINGGIELTNPVGVTDAHTINGNLEATYATAPADASTYYTLNGDIKVSYPANLSADLQFKTFQGEFYTDYPQTEVLPTRVVKNQEQRGDKTVYKLDRNTSVRIGNGGRSLRFETFNGNVYIKKKS